MTSRPPDHSSPFEHASLPPALRDLLEKAQALNDADLPGAIADLNGIENPTLRLRLIDEMRAPIERILAHVNKPEAAVPVPPKDYRDRALVVEGRRISPTDLFSEPFGLQFSVDPVAAYKKITPWYDRSHKELPAHPLAVWGRVWERIYQGIPAYGKDFKLSPDQLTHTSVTEKVKEASEKGLLSFPLIEVYPRVTEEDLKVSPLEWLVKNFFPDHILSIEDRVRIRGYLGNHTMRELTGKPPSLKFITQEPIGYGETPSLPTAAELLISLYVKKKWEQDLPSEMTFNFQDRGSRFCLHFYTDYKDRKIILVDDIRSSTHSVFSVI